MSVIIEQEYFDKLYLNGVYFDICVIRTNLVNDKIFAFGDFQEISSTNCLIFDYAINNLKENNYDISDSIFLSSGDMYGESYYQNEKRIVIKGTSGIVDYQLYNRSKYLYYIYGNHDKQNLNCLPNISSIESVINLDNGTQISGIHGIQSGKCNYPSQYRSYNDKIKEKLKDNLDIFITHEAPLINNNEMNPRNYGNQELQKQILKHKPKIHIFGHCHFNIPYIYQDNILYINTDSRFILLLPIDK
jgi:Icc-related predicted phosphoesterase